MDSEVEEIDRRSGHGPLIRVLLAIRGSFNVFTISLGIVAVAVSIFMELVNFQQGVLAALFIIWGVSAVLLGLSGLLFLRLIGYR
jgi:predicted phage tail protein